MITIIRVILIIYLLVGVMCEQIPQYRSHAHETVYNYTGLDCRINLIRFARWLRSDAKIVDKAGNVSNINFVDDAMLIGNKLHLLVQKHNL